MRGQAVVALAVILDRQLPVALDRVVAAVRDLRMPEIPGREQRPEVALDRVERHGIRVEVDEDHSLEDPGVQTPEPELRLVDALRREGERAQRAVEPVGPAVVLADEPRLVALRRIADARAAVPAHVEQGVHAPLPVPDQDDGFARDLEQEVVALVRDPADVPDVLPGLQEDPADLTVIDFRVVVNGARQRMAVAPRVQDLLHFHVHHLPDAARRCGLLLAATALPRSRPAAAC